MGLKSDDKKLPYPKSVFFIISNEFCERFSYYGMRTILSLYLHNILLYSEKDSTIIYHAFTMLAYFFPIIGAIISDSYLGKFKTILYVSIIYAVGSVVLSLASTYAIGLPQIPFSILGLLLIAIGTGGIKPCVSAFGGDQFVLPQQELQLAAFFSMFYFAINAGSLISTFLTPVLRENVHCFGEESCYPLAFAVPGVLMIVSIVVFALGKPLYTIRRPEGNILVQVSKCIGCGIKGMFTSSDKVEHWLDRAEPTYGSTLVNDIKSTLKVLVLFIPLPIFWALFDQQGSGWTFMASRMDGQIGIFTILPDQMQVINPLLILAFIPMFTYGVYPTLAKCNLLKTPLQKMVCGGLLTALSFTISAFVAFALEATYPELPVNGQCQVRLYNPVNCRAVFNAPPYFNNTEIEAMQFEKLILPNFDQDQNISWSLNMCDGQKSEGHMELGPNKAFYYYLTEQGLSGGKDNVDKDGQGLPKIRTLINKSLKSNFTYATETGDKSFLTNAENFSRSEPGIYYLNQFKTGLEFRLGGVYTTMVTTDGDDHILDVKVIEVTPPNSVHILWLIPQFVIITAGEIMFSITGLELSYSQAPISMKSVLTAAFLLTTAAGNLIIVIIESIKVFEEQSYNFLLYAGLMLIDMILLAFMAMRYKYVNVSSNSDKDNNDLNEIKGKEEEMAGAIDNPGFQFN